MKAKLLAALLALLLLGGTILYEQMRVPQTMQPQTAETTLDKTLAPFPDQIFTTDDGHTFRVQDLKEPTVLVHFWAAWCDVCHSEFPDLIKYVESAHGKIALLSISLDNDYNDSARYMAQLEKKTGQPLHSKHLYWVWDKDKSLSLHTFNTVKVPETIVVGQNHMMMDKIVGAGPWGDAAKTP